MAAFTGISGAQFSFVGTLPTVIIGQDFWPQVEVLQNKLNKFGETFTDFREPLKKVVTQVMIPSINTNFAVGGRPPWQQLAIGTLENRRLSSTSATILVDTGHLRKKATQVNMWVVGRDELRPLAFGPLVSYGIFHQSGTRHMPARPFVVLQDDDVSEIVRIFDEWITSEINRIGWNN